MYAKNFKKDDHIDCKIIVFVVKKRQSWAFDIVLGNWVENPLKK
jgi:hypothetical protein